MAGWTKLFSSIVTSSIWCEDDPAVIRVWIAMLAMCDATGVVEGSIPGFANLARVSAADLARVITILESPDPDSRTRDYEGRRIESIPGGWVILNYGAYRDRGQGKEGSRAPYYREYRSGKKSCTQQSDVAHNAEVEGEAEEERVGEDRSVILPPSEVSQAELDAPPSRRIIVPEKVKAVMDRWDAICLPGSPFTKIRRREDPSMISLVDHCLECPGWEIKFGIVVNGIPHLPFYRGEVAPSPKYKKPFVTRFKWLVSDPSVVNTHWERVEDQLKELRAIEEAMKSGGGFPKASPTTPPSGNPGGLGEHSTASTSDIQAAQLRASMERGRVERATAKLKKGEANL